MSRPLRVTPLVALVFVLAACSTPKKAPDKSVDACDPIVPNHCGFPFPSGVYEEADPSKPSGRHVAFRKATDQADGTLPKISGADTDPAAWADSDGFSPGQAPMTVIEGATATGLPGMNNTALSIDMANSPTILLEDSNEKDNNAAVTPVPHFAEIDVNGEASADNYDRAFMIRPLYRLKDNTHYIVAIRHVKDASGAEIPPGDLFKAIRDGQNHDRDNRYDVIFAKLKKAGVEKNDLQIAWDYHTASKENNTQQLLDMRDKALAALPPSGPEFTITHVGNPTKPSGGTPLATDDKYIGRRIYGKIKVPLFLDSATMTNGDDLHTGYTLQRDADGRPKQNGFGEFDFIVNIPWSVLEDTAPAPILLQGHGLFSDRAEGQNSNSDHYSYLVKFANTYKYVTVTVDMLGWRTPESYNSWPADWKDAYPNNDPNTEDDNTKAQAFVSGQLGAFRGLIDRGTQGMLNQLIAMKMMETSLSEDSNLKAQDGHKFIDTTKSYYRGDSQGGILGVTFMALSQTVSRGYLGEPGLPYNLLLQRSKDFLPFVGILKLGYGGNLNMELVLGLMQMFWDRFEGDGFAPYVTGNPLPGTTIDHHVLLNSAIGDYQVHPIGCHLLARAIGAKVLKPGLHSPLFTDAAKAGTTVSIYGLDEVDGPYEGNALQEYDFGVLTQEGVKVYETNVPPDGDDGYDPHDKVRVLDSAHKSTDAFLRTGKAENHCGADGTVGACVFPP